MSEILNRISNAQYYGYIVGDKFKYKSDVNVNDISGTFSSGDTLILDLDDHSTVPRFRNQYGQSAYELLSLLEKIEETTELDEGVQEATFEVTNCQATTIQEMLLACFDDKISVEISMDSVKVKWCGLTFVVDKEVGLERVLNAIDILSEQQVEV